MSRKVTKFKPFKRPEVAEVFATYPRSVRQKLMALRALIFDTAAGMGNVGEIEEMLKWGQPAYLTAESKSGSTIRIDSGKSRPAQYAMYCRGADLSPR